MKIILRYLSDLHLEFIKHNEIEKFIKKIPDRINEYVYYTDRKEK